MSNIPDIEVKKFNEGMESDDKIIDGQQAVVDAVMTLARIKIDEDRLKKEKAEAKGVIEQFHFNTGARSFMVGNLASVSAYMGSRTTFNKDKMAKHLIESGVASEVVKSAREAATEKIVTGLTVRVKAL